MQPELYNMTMDEQLKFIAGRPVSEFTDAELKSIVNAESPNFRQYFTLRDGSVFRPLQRRKRLTFHWRKMKAEAELERRSNDAAKA